MPYKDKEKQRAYKKEWARMDRAGVRGTSGGTPGGTIPLPFRMRTAQDILALLAEQVGAVRAEKDVGTLEKARCIGYLAGIALRAVEAADTDARLTALEDAIKKRSAG